MYLLKNAVRATCRCCPGNGSAVVIWHEGLGGEQTTQAIKTMIPVMEAKGIEFVYLSQVINQPPVHKDKQAESKIRL